MIKDFWKWHVQKKHLHADKMRPHFSQREVWFAALGTNIGFEQDGKGEKFLRPVVVIKKFNNEIFWGIPTTKKERVGIYYVKFCYRNKGHTTAIISQLRLIDCKRLRYKIGIVNGPDFELMKKRIISFLK